MGPSTLASVRLSWQWIFVSLPVTGDWLNRSWAVASCPAAFFPSSPAPIVAGLLPSLSLCCRSPLSSFSTTRQDIPLRGPSSFPSPKQLSLICILRRQRTIYLSDGYSQSTYSLDAFLVHVVTGASLVSCIIRVALTSFQVQV